MALTRDKMIAAIAAGGTIPITKGSVANMGVGYIASLWRATGGPLWGQGDIPTTAATPTDDTAGGIALPSFGTNTGRIYKFSPTANIAGTWILYDRLAHMGGLDGTSVAAQTVNLDAATAIAAGRATANDIEWYIEIYTDLGNSVATLTATYTDTADTSGKTIVINFTGASPLNRSGRCVRLVPTDGIQIKSIQSVTLSGSSGTAGNFGVTARKRLCSVSQILANVGTVGTDAISIGMPAIKETSCLELICVCTSTSVGTIQSGELVWGQAAE